MCISASAALGLAWPGLQSATTSRAATADGLLIKACGLWEE